MLPDTMLPMYIAITLHHQPGIRAVEVAYIRPKLVLPPKLHPTKLPAAQMRPQDPFGRRLPLSHLPRHWRQPSKRQLTPVLPPLSHASTLPAKRIILQVFLSLWERTKVRVPYPAYPFSLGRRVG